MNARRWFAVLPVCVAWLWWEWIDPVRAIYSGLFMSAVWGLVVVADLWVEQLDEWLVERDRALVAANRPLRRARP
ncbi:hypothetical protein HQ535_15620 [bacterium]|nr:hypothetical protein [bacterium]